MLTALPAITLLFLIGVLFTWFLLIPPALDVPGELSRVQIFFVEWTADGYLGFVTSLLFWMGVAFETPLVFFVMSLLGFVTSAHADQQLAHRGRRRGSRGGDDHADG